MSEAPPTPWWVDIVSGALGGCSGIVVGHPFDTVKVRLQANILGSQATALSCLRQSVRQEGVLSLFTGMSSPLIGNFFMQSVTFGVYGNVLRWIDNADQGTISAKPSVWNVFLAGHVAGLAQLPVVTPAEHFKIAMQRQRTLVDAGAKGGKPSRTLYGGPRHYALTAYQQTGVRGLYKGFCATAARDSCLGQFGIYYGVYEALRQWMSFGSVRWTADWEDAPGHDAPRELSTLATLSSGGAAGCISWTFAYPFDVIKSRVQSISPMEQRRTPVLVVARQVFQEAGHRGFWKGYNTAMLRSFPVNAITFFVYEACVSHYSAYASTRIHQE